MSMLDFTSNTIIHKSWLHQSLGLCESQLREILKEIGIPEKLVFLICLTCLLRNLYAGQEATESDMEQWTGSKLGKEYIKAVYCHPAYLTSMQSTSYEVASWMKHKLESRLPGEISITSYMQMTPSLWQKAKRNWIASWWKWNRRVKKLSWNSTFEKLRSWHLVLSLDGK